MPWISIYYLTFSKVGSSELFFSLCSLVWDCLRGWIMDKIFCLWNPGFCRLQFQGKAALGWGISSLTMYSLGILFLLQWLKAKKDWRHEKKLCSACVVPSSVELFFFPRAGYDLWMSTALQLRWNHFISSDQKADPWLQQCPVGF